MTHGSSQGVNSAADGASRFKLVSRAALLACFILATGCSTTGQSFNSGGLAQVIPGQTTLAEAVEIFESEPQDIWRSTDGSSLVRWAYKSTVLTDAIYLRQEVLLRFDSFGRFQRVVDSVNVAARSPKPELNSPVKYGAAGTAYTGPSASYSEPSYEVRVDRYDPVSAGDAAPVVTPAWNPGTIPNPMQERSQAGIPQPIEVYRIAP